MDSLPENSSGANREAHEQESGTASEAEGDDLTDEDEAEAV